MSHVPRADPHHPSRTPSPLEGVANYNSFVPDHPDTPLLGPRTAGVEYFPMSDSRGNSPASHGVEPPTGSTPGSRFKGPEFIKKRRLAIVTYAGDWVLTIIIIGLFYYLERIHGYWREFSLNELSIQHTYAVHERVPNWALYIIALVAPFVLLPIVNVLTIRSLWDWHHSWLGLLLGLSTTGSLTQVVKVTVGRPRPDFIDRCQPRSGSMDAPVFGLSTAAICTQTDMHILKDGFRSFFSGHSSLSFAGLGFLSWYLAGKLHLFDRRGHTAKSWLALAPLVGALLVAISRTMDNRHHWQDVTVGSIVGLLFSYFAYRQYYPPLSSPYSDRPFAPRHLVASFRTSHATKGSKHHPAPLPQDVPGAPGGYAEHDEDDHDLPIRGGHGPENVEQRNNRYEDVV